MSNSACATCGVNNFGAAFLGGCGAATPPSTPPTTPPWTPPATPPWTPSASSSFVSEGDGSGGVSVLVCFGWTSVSGFRSVLGLLRDDDFCAGGGGGGGGGVPR